MSPLHGPIVLLDHEAAALLRASTPRARKHVLAKIDERVRRDAEAACACGGHDELAARLEAAAEDPDLAAELRAEFDRADEDERRESDALVDRLHNAHKTPDTDGE